MIPKTEIIKAETYQGYLDLVQENDFRDAIDKNTRQFRKLLETIPRKKYDHAYAEGKWTLREVLQHIIDCERVFDYRALRFARLDATPLPSFDEVAWGKAMGGANRRWKDLLEEFMVVRESTKYLFDSFSDEQLRFVGEANGRPLNAFTIGYLVPGHVWHHMKIIRERYLK
ncbi:MAG TPA: DinB family protein [Puia sp.]|nr:DinB family protein [Puia sp.]